MLNNSIIFIYQVLTIIILLHQTTLDVSETLGDDGKSMISTLSIEDAHWDASGTYTLMVTNADNAESIDFTVSLGDEVWFRR